MIHLEKDQPLFTDETLLVFEGGDYEETDLVLVRKIDSEEPVFQFQANFIKNGENI